LQTLSLAIAARGEEGQALPPYVDRLSAIGAVARRGSVSLVAAAPGRGKSALITNWVIRRGIKTLYFSLDTDRVTLGTRILAGILNTPVSVVQEAVDNDDPRVTETLEAETSNVWFSFDPSPSMDDIYDEIQAYAYVQGEFPELIVIDNIKDVRGYGEGEDYKAHGRTVDAAQQIARETSSHVALLHHTKGAYENGDVPIPLGGLLGNLGKTPRLVLTLYQATPGVMQICVVKNSYGRADPSGNLQVPVAWLPERAWFGE